MRVRGAVISVHSLGATVRLEDGSLVAVPLRDVVANRATYTRALGSPKTLPFDAHEGQRHPILTLASTRVDEPIEPQGEPPAMADESFEAQINSYLKATEEWAPADRPPPFERHFIRKKRRAAHFEARTKGA